MRFLIRMKFPKGLSLGSMPSRANKMGYLQVHSDTLFSGLVNQWVKIPGSENIDDTIKALNSSNPPFLLSSTFPFFGDRFYLPLPLGTKEKYPELLKNHPYVELSDFLALSRGEVVKVDEKEGNSVQWFFPRSLLPKVTLDRVSRSAILYQSETIDFQEGTGLYFLLDLRDTSFLSTLRLSLYLLGESGIGSDRSSGGGIFQVEMEEISPESEWSDLFSPNEDATARFCALSLCCPKDRQEERAAVSYDIIQRSGWIFSNSAFRQLKRRHCRMFVEGSLFSKKVLGHLAPVKPSGFKEHEVYRYGLAFLVPGLW
jgi:CRISPR-associated protein Csm4